MVFSVPQSDAHLVLAQAPEGSPAFSCPRLPDGQRNALHLERLKDKLGNRSNASSEVEFLKPAAGWWAKRAMAFGKSSKWAGSPFRLRARQPRINASGLFGGALSCAAAPGIR
jgi:hypothetical protein